MLCLSAVFISRLVMHKIMTRAFCKFAVSSQEEICYLACDMKTVEESDRSIQQQSGKR